MTKLQKRGWGKIIKVLRNKCKIPIKEGIREFKKVIDKRRFFKTVKIRMQECKDNKCTYFCEPNSALADPPNSITSVFDFFIV